MIKLGKDALKFELKPERDWRLVLISFFFLLAGVAFFHYYLFLGFSQGESAAGIENPARSPKPESKLLEKVIVNFEAKSIIDPAR